MSKLITEEIKAELKETKNVYEFLAVLEKNFDLKGAKLGVFTRPILMEKIGSVLNQLNVKPK